VCRLWFEGGLEVPGHPPLRIGLSGCPTASHRHHVGEGIDPVGSARLHYTHEDITRPGTARGAIMQAILAMQDAALQDSFGFVVVERSSGDSQELGQLRPAFLHVGLWGHISTFDKQEAWA